MRKYTCRRHRVDSSASQGWLRVNSEGQQRQLQQYRRNLDSNTIFLDILLPPLYNTHTHTSALVFKVKRKVEHTSKLLPYKHKGISHTPH